jgi:hypothetical protein
MFAYRRQRRAVGSFEYFSVHNAVLGWLRGRLTAIGKSETELAIDVTEAVRPSES